MHNSLNLNALMLLSLLQHNSHMQIHGRVVLLCRRMLWHCTPACSSIDYHSCTSSHVHPLLCVSVCCLQLGTVGTLTLPQIGDGLSKDEVITIKVLSSCSSRGFTPAACYNFDVQMHPAGLTA